MPGFLKDPMAMPDIKGNQWARPAGLLGRNRAGSLPTAAKKAPAANANTFTQAVNPIAMPTSPQNQITSNNKIALYMPGEGPVTSQVPDSSKIKQKIIPSPSVPQPMSVNQIGQYPPTGVAKTAAHMDKLSDANIAALFYPSDSMQNGNIKMVIKTVRAYNGQH